VAGRTAFHENPQYSPGEPADPSANPPLRRMTKSVQRFDKSNPSRGRGSTQAPGSPPDGLWIERR
jgi:hypothetical protein